MDANNARVDGNKVNRTQQHATGACQANTRKTTFAAASARSTRRPQTPEGAFHASRAKMDCTNRNRAQHRATRVQQALRLLENLNYDHAPDAPLAKLVQRPEQTARAVHPDTLSTKMVQRCATFACLDFINYKRVEHRRLAAPVLEDITKPREGISRPTDSKRPFQELQDVMLVQLGIFKSCPTEHYVKRVVLEDTATGVKTARKVNTVMVLIQLPRHVGIAPPVITTTTRAKDRVCHAVPVNLTMLLVL